MNYTDPSGHVPLAAWIIGGAIIGGVVGGTVSYIKYKKVKGWWVLTGAAIGGIAGGVVGYYGGAFVGTSGIKKGTQVGSKKMAEVRRLGKLGEQMSKWPKNTTRIKSLSKTAKYRIPDYLNVKKKVIGEVKNVKKLSYTKQIKDYALYAEKNGYKFILKVRKTTKLSNTLKELIDKKKIFLSYLD